MVRSIWLRMMLLGVGAWMSCSPFLIASVDIGSMIAGASHAVGGTLVILAVVGLVKPMPWQDWVAFILGAWLIVAPLVLDFSSPDSIGTSNHRLVGILVGLIALVSLQDTVRSIDEADETRGR